MPCIIGFSLNSNNSEQIYYEMHVDREY